MRLLRTIGGIDFTGQERAAHNKLTMPLRLTNDRQTGSPHDEEALRLNLGLV